MWRFLDLPEVLNLAKSILGLLLLDIAELVDILEEKSRIVAEQGQLTQLEMKPIVSNGPDENPSRFVAAVLAVFGSCRSQLSDLELLLLAFKATIDHEELFGEGYPSFQVEDFISWTSEAIKRCLLFPGFAQEAAFVIARCPGPFLGNPEQFSEDLLRAVFVLEAEANDLFECGKFPLLLDEALQSLVAYPVSNPRRLISIIVQLVSGRLSDSQELIYRALCATLDNSSLFPPYLEEYARAVFVNKSHPN
jgi:hypothetical protein